MNKSYSTTKLLTIDKPRLQNIANAEFESFLLLPFNDKRIADGGLRTKELFKLSYQNKPLITIVTVVFNGEDFLEETILSVINQTYDNVEYIIIDGGSTDGTIDIIKKYEHAIDYWVSEPDGGIYDAMNKGISLATGDWINFMNAGDSFFCKTAILTLIKSSTDSDVIYGGRNNIHSKYSLLYKAKPFEKAKFCVSFCHQSCIVRLSVHKKYLYDTSFIVSGDTDFFFKLRDLRYRFKRVDSIICNSDMSGVSSIVNTNLRKEKLRIVKRYKLGIFSYVIWEIYRTSIAKIKKLPFLGDVLMRFKYLLFNKRDI
ncbi:glycosyltransferase family 2 protein [Francisella adeliensis]|uniref:Glycosyltransferase n=1 Tax=Francisella adeliensis TaxID=2007306 RepID=A0A2Z4XZ45_9GAMM|nr:glycosyltransferase family 2 protein [Francisella adeliensis]AXA33703.1 hypothetical protein CDH04_04430 [Francisella adeliensis]MBK2085597.1 glycosyltransferase [Francisella adeliensis]MBK2097475.1 glycosyltransferase [Francisella adeliensis]QIW11937.1 glycosyltransferase [Francisella adeliensis]QIW13813.1 glycosyltransferase [Francisella adeliensis]